MQNVDICRGYVEIHSEDRNTYKNMLVDCLHA